MTERLERTTGSFEYDGRRLAYDVVGDGERTVVLTHGLLLSRKMHRPLSRRLAERGYRAVSLDFLGHGESDRPVDMTAYSMQAFGGDILALLDHLGVEQAVVQGTSLGANSTLEAALVAPERIRGMVIEMPVLDNAILGAGASFLPFMLAMRFAAPALRVVNTVANLMPTSRVPAIDMLDGLAARPSGAVAGGAARALLRPHRAAAVGAPDDQRAGARRRPSERPDPPLHRLRRARARAAERRGWSKPSRSWRCACGRSGSPRRSRRSWTSAGRWPARAASAEKRAGA